MKLKLHWYWSTVLYRRRLELGARLHGGLNFVPFHSKLSYQVELRRDVRLWFRGHGVVFHPCRTIGRPVHITRGVTVAAGDYRSMIEKRVVVEDDVPTVGCAVIVRDGQSCTTDADAVISADVVVTRDGEPGAGLVDSKLQRIC